ncbi:MAG: deoxyribose-phosphate aldolase [Williamsia sp.]|nr:deoxyribose-phosphate aldolase [Williamsia sp.]
MNLASYIDHTLLKPFATLAEIEQLCTEAATHRFFAVCVPPPFVKRAKVLLAPTPVQIAAVIGFPFGYSATEAKLAEAVLALIDGADELDMVINLIALRMNDWDYIVKEVSLLTEVVHNKQKRIKVIIESGMLTEEEIVRCCSGIGALPIDFMKTSTGYAERGATVEAVKLMRQHLPDRVKIKASGGIRDYGFARSLVEAGASRLGCSASVAIVNGAPDNRGSDY